MRTPKGQKHSLIAGAWRLVRPRPIMVCVVVVCMVLNRISGLAVPASTKFLIDDVIVPHNARLLPVLVAGLLLAAAVQAGTSFALGRVLNKTAHKMVAELRKRLQSHIIRLPVSFFDARRGGSLLSRIMTDPESVRNLMSVTLLDLLGSLLTAALLMILMFRLNPVLALIVTSLVAGYGIVLKGVLTRTRKLFQERADLLGHVSGRLSETLSGIRLVKVFRAEGREEAVFGTGIDRLVGSSLRAMDILSRLSFASMILVSVVMAVTMYLGALQVLGGNMTLGSLGTFMGFLSLLVAPVFQIATVGPQVSEALGSLNRSFELLSERAEHANPRRLRSVDTLQGDVVFENVTFSYQTNRIVLHDISFQAPPGTLTAIVGPSGSGKSTIANLIAGFITPDTGTIRVDGLDLSTIRLDSYRRHLGITLQEPFLFEGTIYENVAFGAPGATLDDVMAACRLTGVDEIACSFGNYDTLVGERGARLSGGQKQRIAMARVVLANPVILILDEATSNLDFESEIIIQRGLRQVTRGRTSFIIAHRLSTLRHADQILVIDKGRICEFGRHDELYAAHSRYFDLYQSQTELEVAAQQAAQAHVNL